MGLPKALKAHREGKIDEAILHYQRALDQGNTNPVIFQNLGALLREKGGESKAIEIYTKGLLIHPNHIGIRSNRANILHSTSPAKAVQDLIIVIRSRLARGDNAVDMSEQFRSLVALYREMGLKSLAMSVVSVALRLMGPEPGLVGQVLVMLDELDNDNFYQSEYDRSDLVSQLERKIDTCSPFQRAELLLALASHDMSRGDLSRSLIRFENGLAALSTETPINIEESQKRQKLIDLNSWNFGCALLKAQQLSLGWQLYEYGLRTPAEGQQRWQRAMQKPFPSSVLEVWRGENLNGQRLLLLEEQAIGDVMMFLSLVPTLANEAKHIGLVLGDRLQAIYKDVFRDNVTIYALKDAKSGTLRPDSYDYQSPLGSICQYRFKFVTDYSPVSPILFASGKRCNYLRSSYLNSNGYEAKKLVGISWRGGGKPGRIRQKSISPDLFAKFLLSLPGLRFVNLQYGKTTSEIEKWREMGLDIIDDPRIDPLRDMSYWLDQVATCDSVLSVANTTIHGSGGLNIPTLCLLSTFSDWRWFDDVEITRSYWYPSVGIAREDKKDGWTPALRLARDWFKGDCPMPEGLLYSKDASTD